MTELSYKNNEILNGLFTIYYEDGNKQKKKEKVYKYVKFIPEKEWNKDGSLKK